MAWRAITATIVRWPSGDNAAENVTERLGLIGSTCHWWLHQCFRLADLSGIEYKPLLTDGVLLGGVGLALTQLWRVEQRVRAAPPP